MSTSTDVRVRVHRDDQQTVLDLFNVKVNNLDINAYKNGQSVTIEMDDVNSRGPVESDNLVDLKIPHIIYWKGDSEEAWAYDGSQRIQVSCLAGDVVVKVDSEGVYHEELANAMKYFAVCQYLDSRWDVSDASGRF